MSASDNGRYIDLSDIYERGHAAVSTAETETDERMARIKTLKAQIKAGTYKADIKDIAMQLAAAMDPIM